MLGTISLFALGTYVEMNNLMREQADILINARHGLLTPDPCAQPDAECESGRQDAKGSIW